MIPLILEVVNGRSFPKTPEAQFDFLADSIAGLGQPRPRTSREICAAERAKSGPKSQYEILRYEYYVECSCGYKGPALDNACRKCKASIPIAEVIHPF